MKDNELIRVLHLEDDPDDSELVLTSLETLEYKIDYTRVDNEEDFRQQLKENQFDVILADYNLPTFDGVSALVLCSEECPEIPFIIVSGTLGEEIAVKMLKYGASDYLLKQNLKRLAPAIEHSLEEASLRKAKLKTEKELKESEEKFRTITENSADAIFVTDQTGRYVFTNNKVTELLGYTAEEMISKTISDLAPAERINMVLTLFNKLVTEGKVTSELELLRKDGSVVPVDLNAVILPGGFFYGSCRDITERIRATRDLEAAALRWVSTFDSISDIVYIVSKDNKILAINRAGLETVDLQIEEIIGRNCYESIHYSSNPLPDRPGSKLIESGESSSFEYKHNDRFYHLQIWPIPDVEGKYESSVHILKDVTSEKKIQIALEESEKKYRSIFENIQDVYYRINNEGIVTEISPSIFRMSGYSAQEVIGTPSTIFYYHPEERKLLLDNLTETGEVWDYEIKMRTKGGTIKYSSLNAHLIYNENGEEVGIEGSIRDIDERKHFELRLEEAKEKAEESDRLKTAFLHNISHEVRTPMNAIIGFSSLLVEEESVSEDQVSLIQSIQAGSNQLLSIINDIVDISSIEANVLKKYPSNVNINETMGIIYNQFQLKAAERKNSIVFTPDLQVKNVTLETDKTKLIQILSNLISNALKFTQNGKIEFGYILKEPTIEFFVSDTGIGIASDQHKRIFENFYQVEKGLARQFGGTGLGLAISKAYTELLGGQLWLESEPGKGSTFYFNLPYKKSQTALIEENEMREVQNLKFNYKVKILVAEDDDQNFNLLSYQLSDHDIILLRAVSGAEAVRICDSHSDIDIVLMDLELPEMNGYLATAQIKNRFPHLPVIVQTAFVSDREKAISYGCDDFLSKPYTKDEILRSIHKQLQSKR